MLYQNSKLRHVNDSNNRAFHWRNCDGLLANGLANGKRKDSDVDKSDRSWKGKLVDLLATTLFSNKIEAKDLIAV